MNDLTAVKADLKIFIRELTSKYKLSAIEIISILAEEIVMYSKPTILEIKTPSTQAVQIPYYFEHEILDMELSDMPKILFYDSECLMCGKLLYTEYVIPICKRCDIKGIKEIPSDYKAYTIYTGLQKCHHICKKCYEDIANGNNIKKDT